MGDDGGWGVEYGLSEWTVSAHLGWIRWRGDGAWDDVLPMGVLCVGAGGEFCFFVCAVEEDVEPGYESVDIWRDAFLLKLK